jgi:excinuclease ABC subunit C
VGYPANNQQPLTINHIIRQPPDNYVIMLVMKKKTDKNSKNGSVDISDAPKTAGVYLMKDVDGSVLYVGKAKNLRSRVQAYFREKGDGRFSVTIMRDKIRTVEYIPTANENEALLLEDKLIKEYQPRYNAMKKDDKRYPSIKITLNEEYPRVLHVRQREDDGSLYFGPFAQGISVNTMVKKLQDKYHLRRCNGPRCRSNGPCMYAQIDMCSAPCSGMVDREEYMQRIRKVIEFLRRTEEMQIEK